MRGKWFMEEYGAGCRYYAEIYFYRCSRQCLDEYHVSKAAKDDYAPEVFPEKDFIKDMGIADEEALAARYPSGEFWRMCWE